MSSTQYQSQQGQKDAQQGKGPQNPNSFNSAAERNAYNAAYSNAKKNK